MKSEMSVQPPGDLQISDFHVKAAVYILFSIVLIVMGSVNQGFPFCPNIRNEVCLSLLSPVPYIILTFSFTKPWYCL